MDGVGPSQPLVFWRGGPHARWCYGATASHYVSWSLDEQARGMSHDALPRRGCSHRRVSYSPRSPLHPPAPSRPPIPPLPSPRPVAVLPVSPQRTEEVVLSRSPRSLQRTHARAGAVNDSWLDLALDGLLGSVVHGGRQVERD